MIALNDRRKLQIASIRQIGRDQFLCEMSWAAWDWVYISQSEQLSCLRKGFLNRVAKERSQSFQTED